MKKEKAEAKLVRCSFHDLPFRDGDDKDHVEEAYDTVISVQAMHHNNWQGAEKAFFEGARVLKPGGLFFLRVGSDKSALQGNETIVEDKGLTWTRNEGGHIATHHSFSFDELKELADKNNLEIEPGYVDENAVGENFITLGEWNIVFRKKMIEK